MWSKAGTNCNTSVINLTQLTTMSISGSSGTSYSQCGKDEFCWHRKRDQYLSKEGNWWIYLNRWNGRRYIHHIKWWSLWQPYQHSYYQPTTGVRLTPTEVIKPCRFSVQCVWFGNRSERNGTWLTGSFFSNVLCDSLQYWGCTLSLTVLWWLEVT